MKASARSFVVALTICSWIAVSNHCALAALTVKTDSAQGECPYHTMPGKPKAPPIPAQCCKILRALVFQAAKNWARDDAKVSNVDLPFEQLFVPARLFRGLPLSIDTGPPGKTSFVELPGSVRAHAPPDLARV